MIEFNISYLFTHITIWLKEGTHICTTIPGQSGPGSNGCDGIFTFSKSTERSPSDGWMLYPDVALSSSAELQLVYSTSTTD